MNWLNEKHRSITLTCVNILDNEREKHYWVRGYYCVAVAQMTEVMISIIWNISLQQIQMIILKQSMVTQANRAIRPVSRLPVTNLSNPPAFSGWLFSPQF